MLSSYSSGTKSPRFCSMRSLSFPLFPGHLGSRPAGVLPMDRDTAHRSRVGPQGLVHESLGAQLPLPPVVSGPHAAVNVSASQSSLGELPGPARVSHSFGMGQGQGDGHQGEGGDDIL